LIARHLAGRYGAVVLAGAKETLGRFVEFARLHQTLGVFYVRILFGVV